MNINRLRVKIANHYYPEVIDGIYGSSLIMKSKLEKDLKDEADRITTSSELDADEKDQMLGCLEDDYYIAELTTELAGEMMIVALFKTVEISIKKMAKGSGLFTQKQISSFFRVKELISDMKNKVCDITTLPNYAEYDELRCINNSIKHNGVVDKELAKYPNWIVGQKLENLHQHYYRLRNDVDNFVTGLQAAILNKIP